MAITCDNYNLVAVPLDMIGAVRCYTKLLRRHSNSLPVMTYASSINYQCNYIEVSMFIVYYVYLENYRSL